MHCNFHSVRYGPNWNWIIIRLCVYRNICLCTICASFAQHSHIGCSYCCGGLVQSFARHSHIQPHRFHHSIFIYYVHAVTYHMPEIISIVYVLYYYSIVYTTQLEHMCSAERTLLLLTSTRSKCACAVQHTVFGRKLICTGTLSSCRSSMHSLMPHKMQGGCVFRRERERVSLAHTQLDAKIQTRKHTKTFHIFLPSCRHVSHIYTRIYKDLVFVRAGALTRALPACQSDTTNHETIPTMPVRPQ